MPTMKYIGPGTDQERKRTAIVAESEVAALEATGLWKQPQPAKPKEKKDG